MWFTLTHSRRLASTVDQQLPQTEHPEPPPAQTSQSLNATTNASWIQRQAAAPICLLLVYALIAYCFSPFRLFNNAGWYKLEYVAMGAVFTQLFAVMLWGTWSSAPRLWRLPGTVASIVLLASCTSSGKELMDLLLFMGIPLATVGVVLIVVRSRYGWRIVFGRQVETEDHNVQSFSIRYLFLWTTIAALLLLVMRLLEVFSNVLPDTWPAPSEVIASAFLFLSIFIPSIMLGCHVLLARRNWRVSLAYAGVALLSGGLLATLNIVIMNWPFTVPSMLDDALVMFLVTTGSIATMLYSAFWMRWSGFRLVRL